MPRSDRALCSKNLDENIPAAATSAAVGIFSSISRIYHIVDITARHTKVLEVMNVSACIDIHLMFTEDRLSLIHI